MDFEVSARVVVNATGVFVDSVRKMDEPGSSKMLAVRPRRAPGTSERVSSGTTALMVPKTPDGRVLFGIPWHDRLILGTTDGEVPEAVEEPRIQEHEIAFILSEAARYLAEDPSGIGCPLLLCRAPALGKGGTRQLDRWTFARARSTDFGWRPGHDHRW